MKNVARYIFSPRKSDFLWDKMNMIDLSKLNCKRTTANYSMAIQARIQGDWVHYIALPQ